MFATDRRNDSVTVAGLAALAICTTALAHEALGHGSVCWALGGKVTLLSNAYFRCSAPSHWIDLGGPAGNLAVGALALVLARLSRNGSPAWRFYLLCVAAFSLFWEAGYLIFSMATARGDYFQVLTGFFGAVGGPVRIAGTAVGVALYAIFARLLAPRLAGFGSAPRLAWIVAVAVMVGSAALFAPDRLGAMHDAGLSAAAAFPLLIRRTPARAASAIAHNPVLVAVAAVAVVAFALTMGRGLT